MSAEANKALVRPFYAEVDKGSQAPGPIDAYVQSVETAQCNMGFAGTSTGANVVAAPDRRAAGARPERRHDRLRQRPQVPFD